MPSTTNVLDEARDLVRSALPTSTRSAGASSAPSLSSAAKPQRAVARPAARQQSLESSPRQSRHRRRADKTPYAVVAPAPTRQSTDQAQPGISASDVAKTMKIKPNYLYRVLGDLEKEGRVKKDGRQYYPARLSARRHVPAAGRLPGRPQASA